MGHGHVTANADGSKAQCGGPAFCSECVLEAEQLKYEKMYGGEITRLDVLLLDQIELLHSNVHILTERIAELESRVQPAIEQTMRIGESE